MRTRLIERRLSLDPPLSHEALAHAAGIHPKTLAKIEQGRTQPHSATRVRLARALRWTMADLALALSDDGTGPPNGLSVPSNFTHFASLEQGAAVMHTCNSVSLPGLLQTAEYATGVESVGPRHASDADIARRVEHRLERQQVLDGPEPLHLLALIDESILWRTTGGPAVMAAQLAHLRTMNERPNVDLRVVPSDERAHAAGAGSFTLFTGDDREQPYIVVTHNVVGPQYWEFPTMVSAYVELFDHLWRVSDALEEVELLDRRR